MKWILSLTLILLVLTSCVTPQTQVEPVPVSTNTPQADVANPASAHPQSPPAFDISNYAFPDSIDPAKRYLFYLHGKIIEDQGLPAVSPEYGEYEYEAILEKLASHGFVIISEQRPKDADGVEYARRIAEQVTALLNAGVPAKDITVVGASKGAGIAVYVSHFLENEEMNFVVMAICHPDEVEALKQGQIYLYGNILSIYDSIDEFAGSCQKLFAFSGGKIARHNEIVLHVGTGHGILYKPLDEWILPAVQWADE